MALYACSSISYSCILTFFGWTECSLRNAPIIIQKLFLLTTFSSIDSMQGRRHWGCDFDSSSVEAVSGWVEPALDTPYPTVSDDALIYCFCLIKCLKSSSFTSSKNMIGYAGSHCLSSNNVCRSKNKVLTCRNPSTLSMLRKMTLR